MLAGAAVAQTLPAEVAIKGSPGQGAQPHSPAVPWRRYLCPEPPAPRSSVLAPSLAERPGVFSAHLECTEGSSGGTRTSPSTCFGNQSLHCPPAPPEAHTMGSRLATPAFSWAPWGELLLLGNKAENLSGKADPYMLGIICKQRDIATSQHQTCL